MKVVQKRNRESSRTLAEVDESLLRPFYPDFLAANERGLPQQPSAQPSFFRSANTSR